MAYLNNYVVSIIHKGKPQREFGSNGERTVELPFNTEYSIRLKNSTNSRALVDISIDGMSIFSGDKKLILGARQSVDLERFVDSLSEGKKFMFVNKFMAELSGHSDPTTKEFGLISVDFTPEQELNLGLISRTPYYGGQHYDPILRGGAMGIAVNGAMALPDSQFSCQANISSIAGTTSGSGMQNITTKGVVGGTVEGSDSKQEFGENKSYIAWNHIGKTTISLRLKGPSEKKPMPYQDLSPTIKGNDGVVYAYQWATKNPDGTIMVVYK